MKIFAIRDEEMRPIRDLAYLFYYERQKTFYIEIPHNVDPWDLPMILFDFAQEGKYTLDAEWSMTWVRQRIVPTDRQNLGQVLRDNGLEEYDEYRLLLLCHGRCAQDSCYIAEISPEKLPDDITQRNSYKLNAAFPLDEGRMLVFFRDDSSAVCDIRAITRDTPLYRRLFAYYNKFNEVWIQAGGYGLTWGAGQSIPDKMLYDQGTKIPLRLKSLRESIQGNLVDAQEAAAILGCTRQYINLLVKNRRLVPLKQSEKSTLFLRSDLDTL